MKTGLAAAFEAVSKRFGSVPALDRVDFQIGRGETVALLGPNGAGKSTTIGLRGAPHPARPALPAVHDRLPAGHLPARHPHRRPEPTHRRHRLGDLPAGVDGGLRRHGRDPVHRQRAHRRRALDRLDPPAPGHASAGLRLSHREAGGGHDRRPADGGAGRPGRGGRQRRPPAGAALAGAGRPPVDRHAAVRRPRDTDRLPARRQFLAAGDGRHLHARTCSPWPPTRSPSGRSVSGPTAAWSPRGEAAPAAAAPGTLALARRPPVVGRAALQRPRGRYRLGGHRGGWERRR
jgi:hypothetical protein